MQLSTIKQTVNYLRTKTNQIEADRDSLKNLIDVGYTDLTPRPDYKTLQAQTKIDLNIKTDGKLAHSYDFAKSIFCWMRIGNKKETDKIWLPTKAIVEGLMSKYSELQKAKKALEAEHEKLLAEPAEPGSRQNRRFSRQAKDSKNIADEQLGTSRFRKRSEGRKGSEILRSQDLSENGHETNKDSKLLAGKREPTEAKSIMLDLTEDVKKMKSATESELISNKVLEDTQSLVDQIIETKNIIENITKNAV